MADCQVRTRRGRAPGPPTVCPRLSTAPPGVANNPPGLAQCLLIELRRKPPNVHTARPARSRVVCCRARRSTFVSLLRRTCSFFGRVLQPLPPTWRFLYIRSLGTVMYGVAESLRLPFCASPTFPRLRAESHQLQSSSCALWHCILHNHDT